MTFVSTIHLTHNPVMTLKITPMNWTFFGWYCILEYKISNCLLLGNYKAWHFYTKIIFALRNALASEMSHFPKIFCLMYGIWFPKERTLFLHFNGSEGYFTLCCKCWKLGVLFTFLQLKQKAVVIFTQHGDGMEIVQWVKVPISV